MQLIPKALVVGGFVPPLPPGQQQLSADRVNKLWSEVAPGHGFVQLQMAPDHSRAEFLGASPDDGLVIQPPLVQFRRQMRSTAAHAADEAQSLFSVVARHLGAPQLFNLGIRHVYTAPLDDNDARGFVLRHLVGNGDDLAGALAPDPKDVWGGVKFVITQPQPGGLVGAFTLQIEPLQADEMKSLYLDLDAQFQGPFAPTDVSARAAEAVSFLTGSVDQLLDKF